MAKRILNSPFQKFVRIESLGGLLLFSATLLALIIANSPLAPRYEALWQFRLGIGNEDINLVKPLMLWINDGLMAIFFFLIGLEIKRELLIGELNSVKKASFPLFAAFGGMAVPVLLYFILNKNPETSNAWGVPMATDIAFSLAILQLLGKRVPIGLKIFLTAFAIVDDLGAVLVIAIFYSGSLKWGLVAIALLILAILFILSYYRIFSRVLHLVAGMIVWLLFLKAGIHPTIAGVLLALSVPIRQRIRVSTFVEGLEDIVDSIKSCGESNAPLLSEKQIEEIDNLESWTDKVQSPLQNLEHRLHNWVAFLIMPLFAFANAGLVLGGTHETDTGLALLLAVSLVGGKLLGVTLFSWLGIKSRLAELPEGVVFIQVVGVALLAGVGFTMSIFVANLAFYDHPVLLDSAKMGIISGSLLAGMAGYLLLRFSGKKE